MTEVSIGRIDDFRNKSNAVEAWLSSVGQPIFGWRQVCETIPWMCFAIDTNAAILIVNQLVTAHLGHKVESLQGISLLELIHPEDKVRVQAEFTNLLMNQALAVSWECRLVNQSQRYLPVKLTSRLVATTNNPTVVLLICEEITKPQKIEESFGLPSNDELATHLGIDKCELIEQTCQDSEQRYRKLFNSIPDIAFVHELGDPNTRKLIEVNDKACQILGYTREEFLQMTTADISKEDCCTELSFWQEFLQTRKAIFESIYYAKSGYQIPVEVHLSLCNLDNRPAVLGIARDISKRIQVEKALRQSENRYRILFDNGPDGIFVHELGNIKKVKFIEVNDTACQYLGYSKEELLQMCPADLTPEEHIAETPLLNRQVTRNGWTIFQVLMIAKDGRRVPVEIKSILFDYNGKSTILAFGRDISERQRAEEERTKAEIALKQRDYLLLRVAEATNYLLTSAGKNGIYLALKTLGEALSADRAYIYCDYNYPKESPDQQPNFDKYFEWSSPTTETNYLQLRDLTCEYILTDFYEVLSKGQVLQHYCKLSDQVNSGYSLLLLPILLTSEDSAYATDRFWGFIGFEVYHGDCLQPDATCRKWTETEISVLLTATASIGASIQRMQLYEQLQTANRQLQELINLDYLTQVANRLCFDRYLQEQWCELGASQEPLSLIMCDIDFFKSYNDAYGHLGGDNCLRQIAQTLQATVRYSGALVARYGGEEFAIILPKADIAVAQTITEQVRSAVHKLHIPHEYSQVSDCVTLSFGLTTMIPVVGHPLQILIEAADYALFQAKEDGRDRIYSIG